jgi:hypothetical protein
MYKLKLEVILYKIRYNEVELVSPIINIGSNV